MTIKQSLENRIRGWFPREPYSGSIRVSGGKSEIKHPPTAINPYLTANVTKTGAAGVILLTVIGSIILLNVGLAKNLSLTYQAGMFALGIVAGIISGFLPTRKLLLRLSKEIEVRQNSKEDLLLASIPLFCYLIILVSTSILQQGGVWSLFENNCVLIWVLTTLNTMYVMFFAYEKRHNMRLVRAWGDSIVAIIPKPPKKGLGNLKPQQATEVKSGCG